MKNRLSLIMVLGMSLGVAACDTDYGSLDKDPYPNNIPISGVWTGSYSYTPPSDGSATAPASQTVNVVLAATEGNEFWMVEVNATTGCAHIDYGNAYSAQATISGGFGWGSSCAYGDGSTDGNGTISGTAALHDTLTLTFTEDTSKGSLYATFAPSFTFQPLYLEGSALPTLAGSYTDPGMAAVTIDASGNITGATVGSCAAAATLAVINSAYDLYRVNYSLSNCTASGDAHLNGITLSGLGFYVDATSTVAAQFVLTLHGTDTNGTPVVTTDTFTGS